MEGWKMQNKKIMLIFFLVLSITIIILGIVMGTRYFDELNEEQNIDNAIAEKIKNEEIQGDMLPSSIQYSNAVIKAVEYKIISCNKKDKTAVVSFTYINAIKLAEQYQKPINCEADIDDFYMFCVNSIESRTAPFVTKEIEIRYSLEDQNGQTICAIQNSAELADVLTGGTFSEYLKIIGGDN